MGLLRIGRHDRLRTLLSSYIDGRVTSEEAARVDEHLAGCQECQADLENLRATVGLLRTLPELEIPRFFTLDAVPEPVPAPWRFGWATGMAATAAAVLLIALLAGDLTGLLKQTGQVIRVKDAVAVEAPVAAPAAEMAALAAAPTAPGDLAAPAPAVEAATIQAVEVEVAVEIEKQAAPAAAAMAAPEAKSEAAASPVEEKGSVRTVEREVVVEVEKQAAPEAEAPALAARTLRELVPEATAQPQAVPLAAAAPPKVPQADAVTEAVSVPAETKDEAVGVSRQAEMLAPVTTAADREVATRQAPASQVDAEPADGAISLPLRELELATGALLALLVLVLLSFAVRRRRAL